MHAKNENALGILSKSHSYAAQIGMVLHDLEQAVQIAVVIEETLPTGISEHAVVSAATIIEHCNAQKFIMMGLDKEGVDPSEPAINACFIRPPPFNCLMFLFLHFGFVSSFPPCALQDVSTLRLHSHPHAHRCGHYWRGRSM